MWKGWKVHGSTWPTPSLEVVAATVSLLLRHLTWNGKRLLGAMVLNRLDVELAPTRLDVDVCHAAIDNSFFCLPGAQHGDDFTSATA